VNTIGMQCHEVRDYLPGYLDGALPEERDGFSRAAVTEHLSACDDCRHELSRYQKLGQLMAQSPAVEPPAALGVEIRTALARVREHVTIGDRLRRFRDRVELIRANSVAPLALPATGGLVAALLVFAVVLPFYAKASSLTGEPGISDDLPAFAFAPARLEQLAGFSASGLGDSSSSAGVVVVEASVGVGGDVVDYRILAGPDDAAVRRQLDTILLLSRFRPQTSFGRPISGGHVVLSFSTVNVKG
jgi:anti-sigma factor RsiW